MCTNGVVYKPEYPSTFTSDEHCHCFQLNRYTALGCTNGWCVNGAGDNYMVAACNGFGVVVENSSDYTLGLPTYTSVSAVQSGQSYCWYYHASGNFFWSTPSVTDNSYNTTAYVAASYNDCSVSVCYNNPGGWSYLIKEGTNQYGYCRSTPAPTKAPNKSVKIRFLVLFNLVIALLLY